MIDDLMPFDLPQETTNIIKVLGVGGGGSNAVNHMYEQGIKDVEFVVCNTDSQALVSSPVPMKIQLGSSLTEGRGAGNKPDVGRQAAIENIEDIKKVLEKDTKMIFITAGMGGGTGTGAAPVIAQAAKEMDILTVAIVTIPFRFEGQRRIKQAIEGISEITEHVDSLLVINNEKLREISGDLRVTEAFSMADNVLTVAAKGIAEIITVHGHVNVDFADVQTVMTESGVALMGSASAEGPDRALNAIKEALSSPLLNNNDIRGAKNLLLNITAGSEDVTMDEIGQINEYVQEAAGYTADLIWGNTRDENLGSKVHVTVIATGFETDIIPGIFPEKMKKTVVQLEDKTDEKTTKIDDDFIVTDNNRKEQKKKITIEDPDFSFYGEKKEVGMPVNTNKTKNGTQKVTEEEEVFVINEVEDLPETKEKTTKPKTEKKVTVYNPAKYAENIEEFENVPAYVRKQINIKNDNLSDKNEVSRYSLYQDENETKLRSDNSYLHDNVD